MLTLKVGQKVAFADFVLGRLSDQPLSAISKSELELTLFQALVYSDIVNIDDQPFEISLATMIPLARVESLIYRHRLSLRNPEVQFRELAKNLTFVNFNAEESSITIHVQGRYFKELLTSKLKTLGVFTESSFNKELLTISNSDLNKLLQLISPADAARALEAQKKAASKFSTKDFAGALGAVLGELGKASIAATVNNFIGYYK